MKLGVVKGNVVATTKDEGLVGMKLLIVQPTTEASDPCGDVIVAVDTVGAGFGDRILYVTGSSARSMLTSKNIPVDASIVAIVDTVEVY
ncbi:EutN/CcmL family microcompartment protein [Fusibacter ferrireducens]|uniref:EutN/CcmL family microcompartment protein n=1 Tax=Fusibacter ferrireducens TaxID=2785058 RepID=A0ABR9ZZN8_9FIRM|nr:EutN/CcmL family microcompartment protein [Fusibacter ferrireducens]MBF4695923.1 EutN/CcmL family microcompartment protein [Fusibacter ferrireducens]